MNPDILAYNESASASISFSNISVTVVYQLVANNDTKELEMTMDQILING
jgi:hypothetical protein